MSVCDTCPKPGACCKRLRLHGQNGVITFWKEDGLEAVQHFLDTNGLPFAPIEIVAEEKDEPMQQTYVEYVFSCPKLGLDGRCTIYADRPQLCRDYQPGSDQLCVLYKVPG